MGLGRIVIALFEDVLHPDWEKVSKAEVRAAMRQERQITCCECGLPGGTMVNVGDRKNPKYRHQVGFCRKGAR